MPGPITHALNHSADVLPPVPPTPDLTLLISTPHFPHPQRPAGVSPRNVALATAPTAGKTHPSRACSDWLAPENALGSELG